MNRLVKLLRSYWWVIAAAAGLVVLGLVIAFASSGRDDPVKAARDAATATAAAAPTGSPDQEAVNRTVNQFVSALASGNVDALYALQTDAYRQSCSRQDFGTIAQALTRQQLSGPVTAAIQGDRAVAELFDATGQQASLQLSKAADGSWRIVAAAPAGGCR